MEKKIPIVCDLILSEKCNARCKMCHMWKHASSNELSFEECKNFFNDLKTLVNSNSFEINLGGGEPLLRKDILDLIRLCAKNSFSSSITTNGYLLDEEMAKKISDTGLKKLILSLASLKEETHDSLRGIKGSFACLMAAIDYLRKYWPTGEIYVNAIIKEQNLGDIVALAEWVERDSLIRGIGFQAIAQPFFTPRDDFWYKKEEYACLWPQDTAKVCSVIDQLIEFKSKDYKIGNSVIQLNLFKEYYKNPHGLIRKSKCNFGDYIMNITTLGEVLLCVSKGAVGNIKKNSIADIWNGEAAVSMRHRMHECALNCNNIINCWFRPRNEF